MTLELNHEVPNLLNSSFRVLILGFVMFCSLILYPASLNGQTSCLPTPGDMEGPYYVAGAPVRSKIGSGLIVRGFVKSSANCGALQGARIEWWQVNPQGE